MRSVLSAFILAAAAAGPVAAQPVVYGVPGPYVHTPSGTYVQYYDPRTGVPVGGPVPVSEAEFAVRAARVPADAPVIRVRPAPTVTDLGVERVVRPRRVVRPHVYAPRYGVPVHARSARYRDAVYVGPRRLAPAPFRYGRPVRGYEVVPLPRRHPIARHHGPRGAHRFGPPPHHRMGGPAHHRMGPPHGRHVGAVERHGPRGPAPRPGRH